MCPAHHNRIQFFDELAEEWNTTEEYRQDQQRLKDLIPRMNIGRGHKILDVGSGTGITLKLLQQATGENGHVVGFDISMPMLKKAKNVPCPVVRGDCHQLPFLSRSFDLIFALGLIPHLDDIPGFFAQAGSVLRENGNLIVLHLMSREEINDFHRNAGTAVKHDLLPSKRELTQFARKEGIEPTHFEEAENLFLWMGTKVV